jgi:phosphoglycerate dehydrogenase-like enzyme
MKAIFRYDAGPRLTAEFAALAGEGFIITRCPEHDDERFARLLPDAEVLLHILKPPTKAVIDRAPALRLIRKIGVGVNTIDLVAARARGIAIANMPGTNTRAVAETAPLLMLAALRNLADLAAPAGWGAAGPSAPRCRLNGRRSRLI